LAGRKPKADVNPASSYLDIEVEKKGEVIEGIYRISYRMDFVYGSKIPKGMKRNDFRTYLGNPMTKNNAKLMKAFLTTQGQKDVKLEKMKMNLPTKCPSCQHNGTPSMYQGKGTLRKNDSRNEINRKEIRLIYNHSKTKPKTCFIGIVKMKFPLEINLKSKFKKNVLSMRNRVGVYPLPKDFKLSD
jgi:hypothetical protein